MAVEKLAEGIRKFAVDQEKLEAMLSANFNFGNIKFIAKNATER